MARKTLRRVRSCKLKVYEVPDAAKLDAFSTWAIVRQNPELVRAQKKLSTDPSVTWWLPITWSSVNWPAVFWLDVVSVKIEGRIWPGLCVVCDLKLPCAEEGRGVDIKHECRAERSNLVDIKPKKRKPHEQAASV